MPTPTLYANTPAAGQIQWDAFTIAYGGQSYAIAAGYTANKFVWWRYNNGAGGPLEAGDTLPDGSDPAVPVLSADDVLLFLNKTGTPVNAMQVSIIDGSIIATESIIGDSIAANTITGAKIAANTISANEIAAGGITSGAIAAGAIVANLIGADAVVAGKVAAGAVSAREIAAGTITANEIAAGGITSGAIAAGAIVADLIGANAVIAGKIAAGAVTATEIAAGAITTAKLAAGAVTANEVAANAITSAKIAATAIDGKTITGATIQTTATAARGLKLSGSDLLGYDAAGAQTIKLSGADGSATLTKATITGTIGASGLQINGALGDYMKLRNDGSNNVMDWYDHALTNPGRIYANNNGGIRIEGPYNTSRSAYVAVQADTVNISGITDLNIGNNLTVNNSLIMNGDVAMGGHNLLNTGRLNVVGVYWTGTTASAPVTNGITFGTSNITANASGYDLITHNLGAVPSAFIVTAASHFGTAHIYIWDKTNSAEFNCRVYMKQQNATTGIFNDCASGQVRTVSWIAIR